MKRELEQLKMDRRWLHQHPEIGFDVYKTKKYILNSLHKLEIYDVSVFAETGIRAVFKKEGATKTIGFRSDMDALSIQEKNQVSFASQHHGYMHACGHDGHMAILLGFARWVKNNQNQITTNIVLIFQPAEESVGGALPMIQEGVLENPHVDEIYGTHIFPEIEQGSIGVRSGALMSQASEFDLIIYGKSAHGAKPYDGKDALVAACELTVSLQKIISRELPSDETAVLTIGKLSAGDRRNIIAEKAVLEGTLRTYSEERYCAIKKRIKQVLSGIELTSQVTTQYEERTVYPVVYNNQALVEKLRNIIKGVNIVTPDKQMIAEDFSQYQKVIPGVFIFLGSRNKKKGYTYPLHSSQFNFDEEILLSGINVYKQIVMNG